MSDIPEQPARQVLWLAALQGHHWPQSDEAERIAAGAAAAIAAVISAQEAADFDPFDVDPEAFSAALDALAAQG